MPGTGHFHCPVCGQERAMVTVRRAADAAGVTVRTIYRWIERQKVHAMPVASGQWRICKESLFQHDRARGKRRTKDPPVSV